MKKNIFILLPIIVVLLIGCESRDDKYLGVWKTKYRSLTIYKDGDLFVVDDYWSKKHHKYIAKLVNGSLKFTQGMFGELNLSEDGTRIYFGGDEYQKQPSK